MIGVYKITHLSSGKYYIGQSVNIKSRWSEHKRTLKNKTHRNPKLQAYWGKYGEDAFIFEVLEECSRADLDTIEQKYLNEKPWFNVARYASSPARGRKCTKETIAKRVSKTKGLKRTIEVRQKISKAKKGVPQTIAHRAALSKVRKGAIRPTNRRRVQCVETKEIFAMVKDAVARFGGEKSAHLCSHLNGHRKQYKGHTFVYVDIDPNWKKRGKNT